MFIQEHWYLQKDVYQLCNNIPFVDMVGVSGMDESILLMGRPYGGCAILYHKCLNWSVSVIHTESRRICACICKDPSGFTLLLINLYMPCDTAGSRIATNGFSDALDEVSRIIIDHSDIDYVIMGGDLNTDLSRVRSSHSAPLQDFCTQHSLRFCFDHSCSDVNFTYKNEWTGVKTTLDHFIVTDNLFSLLSEYFSPDEIDNFSDHDPVFMSLNLALNTSVDRKVHEGARPSWTRASDVHLSNYKNLLRERMAGITIPFEAVQCVNSRCSFHEEVIAQYYTDIVNAMKSSAADCIPKHKKRAKAGWTEFVSPARDQSIFWHKLWVDCGRRPHSGWVNQVRLRTKAEYKRLSKWVVRNQERLVAERMADKLCFDANRDFWAEVKKVRSNNANSCTNVIDDVAGEEDICKLFASKYEDLYQSVSFNEADMERLLHDADNRMNSVCDSKLCYSDHSISFDSVKKAVAKLKCGKPDSDSELSSDHYVNAPDELFVHLSLLLSCMLQHQKAPTHALLSVLRPIPKNRKKSLNQSSNYRSIAISSVLLKILDNVILCNHSHILCTNDMQFGFKPKHGTNQCTFVVNQVVDYYSSRGSYVYVTLLDASRAFDRVNYVRLFELLLQRGLCPMLIKFLLYMYTCQSLVVRWQEKSSQPFECRNGIKQGAVLSPILFCVYMDTLLERLRNSGVGCYIGHVFTGAVSYADDLTLLAPSHHATQVLLDVCTQFASEFDVMFNSSKSNIIVFNPIKDSRKHPLYLCQSVIPYCEKATHLGILLGNDSMKCNITKATQDFVSQVNMLICNYSHCHFESLCYLFNSYCTSFYGCPLWNLSENVISSLYTVWRKSIRRLFNLSNMTRSKFLPLLLQRPDFKIQLYSRFASFYMSCLKSQNSLVYITCQVPPSNSNVFHNNIQCLLNYLEIPQIQLDNLAVNNALKPRILSKYYASLDPTTIAQAHVIKELIQAKQSSLYIGNFSFSEIDDLLSFLCTQRDV